MVAMLTARMEAHIAKRTRKQAGNPMYTNLNWHGKGTGPFKSSQEAYDTMHIGSPKAAQKLQAGRTTRGRIRMKVCVIGMGHIGNLHADIYKEDEMVELAGVCDIIEERARRAGERLGVPWFLDAQQMLDEVKPDLCSVTTGGYEYGSDHYKPTMEALAAGCHVLCEKPLSNDIGEAAEMVALAREQGLCLGTNMNHRFTPAARQAKQWQLDGRIGDLLFVNMALWIGKFQELESPYYHLKALNPTAWIL